MRAFDWERRVPPQGLVDIERARRREMGITNLDRVTKDFRNLNIRSQWDTDSLKKAHFVSQVLNAAPEDKEASAVLGRSLGHVSDEIRAEELAKIRLREAEIAGAAERRHALLQQAMSLVDAKQMEKTALLAQHRAKTFENNSPEIRDLKKKQTSRELAVLWQQQLNEKTAARTKAASSQTKTPAFDPSELLDSKGPQSSRNDRNHKTNLIQAWNLQNEEIMSRKKEEQAANCRQAMEVNATQNAPGEALTKYERQLKTRKLLDNAREWKQGNIALRKAWEKGQREKDVLMQQAKPEHRPRAARDAHMLHDALDGVIQKRDSLCYITPLDKMEEVKKREEFLQAKAKEAQALRLRMQTEMVKTNDCMVELKRLNREKETQNALQERKEQEYAARAYAADAEGQKANKEVQQALQKATFDAQIAAKELRRAEEQYQAQERESKARLEKEYFMKAVAQARQGLIK